MPTILLIHSPLLTAATWDGLRPHLEAAGWQVVAPDFRHLIETRPFHAALSSAAAASVADTTPAAVVAHSRAGAYLPGIIDAIAHPGVAAVFLDARLPYPGTSWIDSTPPDRATWLRKAAAHGRLPAWDRWFPAETFDHLRRDPTHRRALQDLPELPWELVTETLPEPGPAWHSSRRVYIQLSPAYRPTADQAEKDGYEVHRASTDHLAMITDPALVANLLRSALST
ncbi:hypothetical protein [Asanoa sp. NPDC050611]|uniref:hypothetical protein n=1 Tax=Asanoa sp. NPDC050611 TaxID=3157098 RepID=UPI00340DAEA0